MSSPSPATNAASSTMASASATLLHPQLHLKCWMLSPPTTIRRRAGTRRTASMFLPTRMVVARVAMAYFSTTTIPVMSWVTIQDKVLPHVIRNNHVISNSCRRRYHVVSLDPLFRSTRIRQYESRVHMSVERESDDNVDQTSSSSSSSLTQVTSLTSEMLALRFRDVFAHFRSLRPTSENTNNPQTIQIPDDSTIRMNLLRTRHANLELDKCRIDVSTIPNAGYGVYAAKAIPRNELITLYPGDALIQWKHKDHMDPATDGGIQIFFGTHIPESERSVAALDNNSNNFSPSDNIAKNCIFMNHIPTARGYEVRINDTISVIGDPNRKLDPAYLGHMINDYCMIHNMDDIPDNAGKNEEETIRQYNIKSIQKSNCKIEVGIDQCHVEIIATRDIASGEELFLSYGSNYWLSRRTATTTTKRVSTPFTPGRPNVNEATTASNTTKPGFGNKIVGGKVKTKRK